MNLIYRVFDIDTEKVFKYDTRRNRDVPPEYMSKEIRSHGWYKDEVNGVMKTPFCDLAFCWTGKGHNGYGRAELFGMRDGKVPPEGKLATYYALTGNFPAFEATYIRDCCGLMEYDQPEFYPFVLGIIHSAKIPPFITTPRDGNNRMRPVGLTDPTEAIHTLALEMAQYGLSRLLEGK